MSSPFDFITYDDEFLFKQTSTFDPEFSLSSPFSEHSDLNGLFPPFLPKTIQNLLDPDAQPTPNSGIFSHLLDKPIEFQKSPEQPVIFEASPESIESPEIKGKKTRSKLNPESKRISKRENVKEKAKEKTKERTKAKKTSTEVLLQIADPKHIPAEMQNPDLDSDTRKKMVQMIRNRISAQNSRDRKKFYIQQLEEMRDLLTEENDCLLSEKTKFIEKIKKLEGEQELLLHQISDLKKSLPPNCSGCGATLDYGAQFDPINQETTEDNSSREGSGGSSPLLERGTSRMGRGFFGFSMTFTALLCLFFVLSSGEYNRGISTKTTLVARIPRSLDLEYCQKPEEDIKIDDLDIEQPDVAFFVNKQSQFHPRENQILNKVRHLMDQFENFHQSFYKTFEQKKSIVDLTKEQIPDIKTISASQAKQNTSRNFLEKLAPIAAPNTTKNRTSTLFCPNGFEFFKSNSSMVPEGEQINNQNMLEVGPRTLDLEKAEYIQLVLPKQSIGRLGVGENSSEISHLPTVREAEEPNSLIEVWCKVFAVRDLATSL